MESKDIKKIYLIAICGTGMAALAGLLKKAGHNVTGSDANVYPPMSTLLNDAGIKIFPGYKKENISNDIEIIKAQINILLGIMFFFLAISPWASGLCIRISLQNK